MDSLLEAALGYAKLGWRVFPAGADKRPIIGEWQNAATTDETQIRAWWSKYLDANIAIVLDPPALVVDVDVLEDGQPNRWPTEPIPDGCPIQDTPRGGRHIFVRLPDGVFVGNSVGKLAHKVDTRGCRIDADGSKKFGYVLVAPSRQTGRERPYAFLNALASPGDIPPCPEWLLARLTSMSSFSKTPEKSAVCLASSNALEQAREWLGRQEPAISGSGGHQRTFAVACGLAHGFALDEDAAYGLLLEYNSGCSPEWSEPELRHKAEDAVRSYSDLPDGYLLRRDEGELKDFFAKAGDPASSFGGEALPESAKPSSNPYSIKRVCDIIVEDAPQPESVIEGVMARGDRTAVIAKSKMAKTFFVTQEAFCLAMELQFLGLKLKRQRVLIVQLEGQESWYKWRLCEIGRALGIKKSEVESLLGNWIYMLSLTGEPMDILRMIDTVRENKIEFVIFDPLYALVVQMGMSENDSTELGQVLALFSRLQKATHCSIEYVHHDTKGMEGDKQTQDRGSGSNILGRDYDNAITLSPDQRDQDGEGGLVVLEFLSRNYPRHPKISAVFNYPLFELSGVEPVKLTNRNKNSKAYLVEKVLAKDEAWTWTEQRIADEAKVDKSTVSRYLKKNGLELKRDACPGSDGTVLVRAPYKGVQRNATNQSDSCDCCKESLQQPQQPQQTFENTNKDGEKGVAVTIEKVTNGEDPTDWPPTPAWLIPGSGVPRPGSTATQAPAPPSEPPLDSKPDQAKIQADRDSLERGREFHAEAQEALKRAGGTDDGFLKSKPLPDGGFASLDLDGVEDTQ